MKRMKFALSIALLILAAAVVVFRAGASHRGSRGQNV